MTDWGTMAGQDLTSGGASLGQKTMLQLPQVLLLLLVLLGDPGAADAATGGEIKCWPDASAKHR